MKKLQKRAATKAAKVIVEVDEAKLQNKVIVEVQEEVGEAKPQDKVDASTHVMQKADREKAQGGDDDVDYGVDLSLGEASDDDDDLGVDAYYRQAHMTYVRDYIVCWEHLDAD